METRPLTLKNSDNKLVAAVTNHAISPVIQACSSAVQNGFVQGRQLTQNIVDLDHASRLYACTGHSVEHPFDSIVAANDSFNIGQVPVTVLFDFAAAFPSVVHAWLFIVLRYIKMPEGLQRLIQALYENNQAYGTIEGQSLWLFAVCGGVLQGCPLSGSLFVLGIDPLLYLFSHYLHSADRGRVRACADDIGIALRKLEYLKHVYRVFDTFAKISGLKLKPRKCVLILTSLKAVDENISTVRRWLVDNIPEWTYFKVTNHGKYLGVYLGPDSAGHQWITPIQKFRDRVTMINASKGPLSLAALQFNTKALSVLQYVGQLVPPPQKLALAELASAGKVLGVATNALTAS